LFRPNKIQTILFHGLWYFNIVPKARQLGVTTFFAILYFDQILFSKNKTAGIIAHRQEDMKKIFRNKIKFAWNNLHPWLRNYIGEPSTDSQYELVFPNGSTIFVSMSTRSGTVQFLHISEFGYICQKFPEKADEIVSGAINSVHIGNMVSIESTSAGREGYFFDFCTEAQKMQLEGRELSQLDFKLFFFPWWEDPRYVMDGEVFIDKEFEEYFEKLKQSHGIKLSNEQKSWYIKKKKVNKEKMFSEFPSTLDEAFQVSSEGAYYKNEMRKVYSQNRILPIAFDSTKDVDTWWDLGMNDFNVILFTQSIGGQIRFIDMHWNNGEGLKYYCDVLKEKQEQYGYKYGKHNFPHDIEVRDYSTGIARSQFLFQQGLRNIRIGKKESIQDGIDQVRNIFSRFYFDEGKCKELYNGLFNYRKEFDKKLGQFKDKPKRDKNSHFADSVRLLGQLWRDQLENTDGESGIVSESFF